MSAPAPYAARICPEDGTITRTPGGDSDVKRLLGTFARQPVDRLPTLEYLIDRRAVEAILGRPAASSWALEPADFVELAQRIGQDAIGGPMFASPSRLLGDVRAGELIGRDDLRRLLKDKRIRPAVVDHARIERFLRAAEPARLGLWHHVGGGLSAVYDAMGIENFALTVYDDPGFILDLLRMIADDNARIIEELARYPFAFFHLGDDIAHKGGLFVSADFLREHWLPLMKQTIAPAGSRGIPVTFHGDGNLFDAIPLIIEAGFVSLNPLEPYGMDVVAIKRRFGDRLTLIGNIDVAGPLAFGTPQQVADEVRQRFAQLAPGGGYIGATSHSVIDQIPPANFIAMLEAFRGARL